jgi:hypothetical protein
MAGTLKKDRSVYQGHKNSKDGGLAQGMIQGTLDNAVYLLL